eukprot:1557121-Alexandrium_andersonii.AAC.1
MRLTGLRWHGDPIQCRPAASAGRPPGGAAKAGDDEPPLGQPGQDRTSHFDRPIIARLGKVGVPVAGN